MVIHEYAGFHYDMDLDDTGKAISAHPLIGQHKAAGKDKHRKAAVETYNEARAARQIS